MVVLFTEMENTRGAGCKGVSDEFSVGMLSYFGDIVELHSTTRCTRLELEREACVGEKNEGVMSMKSIIEAITVANVSWGI